MAQASKTTSASRRFRLQGKSFIITWPQCNELKETVLNRIVSHYQETLAFAIVSHENHQDGSPHLHAVLSFKEKKTFSGANCFDSLANSHGNYQTARQLRQSVKYVVKDGDFIAHGVDVSEYLQAAESKQSTKATLMALELAKTGDLASLNEIDPGFVMMNLRKLKEYQANLQTWTAKPPKTWTGLNLTAIPASELSPALVSLAGWLNKNLGRPRRMRQKQLLLSSPPGFGKTTLKETLREYFTIYDHSDSKWFCDYDPKRHDIICFEEFRGLPLTLMNKVMDGSIVRLETKGGSVVKDVNCPVMILTNLEADEMFTGSETRQSSRAAFFDRCHYIRLEEGDEAWKILPLIPGFEVQEVSSDDESTDESSVASSSTSSSVEPLVFTSPSESSFDWNGCHYSREVMPRHPRSPVSDDFIPSRCDDY